MIPKLGQVFRAASRSLSILASERPLISTNLCMQFGGMEVGAPVHSSTPAMRRVLSDYRQKQQRGRTFLGCISSDSQV